MAKKRRANGNQKGKVGEREIATLLKQYGFEARRGQQFSGGGDSPDVVHDMEGFHIEVKRTEALSIYQAMKQAQDDAHEDQMPLVFHRRNGKRWLVVIDAENFLTLVSDYVFETD